MAKKMPKNLGRVERLAPVTLPTDPPVPEPPSALDRGAKQRRVPLHQIQANPGQPRRHFDAGEIEALAVSIAEHGLIQPIVVRKIAARRYEIVAGERRYRALMQLHVEGRLPEGGVPVLVHETMSDADARLRAYIENSHRAELRPVEDAEALGEIVEERTRERGKPPTLRELADVLPLGRTALGHTMRIYDALQDPELGPLVRHADKLGKALLFKVLGVDNFASRHMLLHLAADGATPQEVQAHLAKAAAKPKAGRPMQWVTRTRRGDGYDLLIRVRGHMGAEEAEGARPALEEALTDLQRRIELYSAASTGTEA